MSADNMWPEQGVDPKNIKPRKEVDFTQLLTDTEKRKVASRLDEIITKDIKPRKERN